MTQWWRRGDGGNGSHRLLGPGANRFLWKMTRSARWTIVASRLHSRFCGLSGNIIALLIKFPEEIHGVRLSDEESNEKTSED